MKAKLKLWVDANVWDGEDRSGAKGDSACFNPDELQELIEDLFEYVIPEGCTPADAKKLREFNHGLAAEVEQLKAKVAELEPFKKAKLDAYRSGGFLNKDCDMARVYIDLPIIEAKQLIFKLKAGEL